MLQKNILDEIKGKMSHLPPSQQAVGEYILNNYHEVAILSALQLGNRIGVSDATVVRFAQNIGYTFNDMKNEIFKLSSSQETPSDRMINSIQKAKEIDSTLADIFENDIKNIEQTFKSFSNQKFYETVNAIIKSNKVYIMGINSCESLANLLNFHFSRLLLDTRMINCTGLVLSEKLAHISEKDILIVISFPRYSNDSLKSLEYAKEQGAKTILITDKEYSMLAEIADYVLVAKCSGPSFYNSFSAVITLFNCIVFSISLINRDKSYQALKKVEQAEQFLEKQK